MVEMTTPGRIDVIELWNMRMYMHKRANATKIIKTIVIDEK